MFVLLKWFSLSYVAYTDPLRVLICGGSTPGPAQVLDSCVSIEPEVENATWTLERMVRPTNVDSLLFADVNDQAFSPSHVLYGSVARW